MSKKLVYDMRLALSALPDVGQWEPGETDSDDTEIRETCSALWNRVGTDLLNGGYMGHEEMLALCFIINNLEEVLSYTALIDLGRSLRDD